MEQKSGLGKSGKTGKKKTPLFFLLLTTRRRERHRWSQRRKRRTKWVSLQTTILNLFVEKVRSVLHVLSALAGRVGVFSGRLAKRQRRLSHARRCFRPKWCLHASR